MQNPPISQQSIYSLSLLIKQFLGFNKTTKSQDKKQLKQVQNKLKIFSKSVNYFPLAYEYIINKNDTTYQELFIVSLLVRDKFRYEFDKYSDEESIVYLENMIKQIIKKYDNNPPETFSSNICVCMICLYMKRAELLKEKYKQTGILEYFKSFVSDNKGSDYFYKALEYTPEEVYSSKIVMDQIMRQRIKMLIKYDQYPVLKHLNSVAQHLWENKIIKKNHLFACLENWINMGYKEALFQQLPNHYLVKKLFDYALDTNFSKQTTDCIKAIIKKMKSIKKDEGLFTFLGTGVFKLIESIKSHIKQYGPGGEANQAIQIVADFGALASQFFIDNYNPDVKNFLQSTIEFIKLQDIDVYPNLVDFWQIFINNAHRSDKIKQNPQYIDLFKKLYAAVCYKTSWNMEMIEKMNELSQRNLGKFHEQAENLLDRRQQTQSLFQILAAAFGKQQFIKFVLGCISLLPKDQPKIFWPTLQSYLNSLKHAIKQLLQVSQNVQILVTLYNEVSNPYCAIKNVFMSLFKSLMSIEEHNQQLKSQFIIHLFKIIAENLNNPRVQEKAQRAFSKGCEKNPSIVINYIEDFINLLKEHEGNQEIVRGVMHVLSSNFQALNHFLPKVLTVLFQVFTGTDSNLKKKNIYHAYYSVFKILMTYKNKEHFKQTLQEFTKTMWPYLINTLSAPKDIIDDQDPEVQRAVKLIKYLMRCLRQSFEPFLQSLFSTVHQAYQKYPICSYIYMLQVSVTVFYEQKHLNDYFRAVYKNFCETTYNHLKTKQNISSYQLLIDDFIGMNKRLFIYNSSIVLQSGQLPYLIETCINLSNVVDIPQVSKSAYQFFQTIFMVYWSQDFIRKHNQAIQGGDKFQKNPQNQNLYKQLKQFIIPKLPEIIMKMINHLQSVPLQSTTQCILDCLLSQIKGFWQINQEIWMPILNAIPQQILTITQKNEIYQNLLKVGDYEIQICRDSAARIDRLIYIMNKRFVNNLKRRL